MTALIIPAAAAAGGYNTIHIIKTDGTSIPLHIEPDMEIRVADGALNVSASTTALSLPLGQVSGWEYSIAGAIDDVRVDKANILFDGNRLSFPCPVDVAVYTTDGRCVRSLSGASDIDFSDLMPGAYIVACGDAPTFKIAVR